MEVDDSSDSKQSTNSGQDSGGKELNGRKHLTVPGRKRGTTPVVKQEMTQDSSEMELLAQ